MSKSQRAYQLQLSKNRGDNIKKTTSHFNCTSCYGDIDADEKFLTLPCCKVLYCHNCTVSAFTDNMACTVTTCQKKLPPLAVFSVVKYAVDNAEQWVGKRMMRSLPDGVAWSQMNSKKCLDPLCIGFMMFDGPISGAVAGSVSDQAFAVCNACNRVSCVKCDDTLSAHASVNFKCKKKSLTEDYSMIAQALGGNCKQCPSCLVGIERIDGCNTITCEKCSYIFCWLCGLVMDKCTVEGSFYHAHDHFNIGKEYSRESCHNLLYNGEEEYERRTGKKPYTTYDI